MAELNENKVLDGENKVEEPKTPDENKNAPVAFEFTDTGGDQPGQTEPPATDTPEAPQVADGDVVVPSNVIDGLFDEKRAAAKEAEKQAAAMDKGEADPPEKTGRGGKPPKEDKTPPKKDTPDKSDKVKNEKPPKAPKEKQGASVGGGGIGGGASGQTPDKDKTPSVPAIPEMPEAMKDATRPGKKETIVYIDHSELHPYKDHPLLEARHSVQTRGGGELRLEDRRHGKHVRRGVSGFFAGI